MTPHTPTLTENALAVLKRRYLARDAEGRVIETPQELFRRVARFIAEADRGYGADDPAVTALTEQFYQAMADLEFLPNSPTLMNAGRPLGQLSACFVLPVGDSMEEIFETNKHAAVIHKTGGGTGFSFSRLRPRNSVVASTSGVASGPVSFMKVYNASTEAVKQGGTRRGANMGILRVDHPDILEFIGCKEDTREITNFNISVAITDAFMTALASGAKYPLLDPRTGKTYLLDGVEQALDARLVFDRIVEQAWKTGEPGIIFIDRMNRGNPTWPEETIEATNPCGEQPLPPYDSCNLGSINLGRFALEPLPDTYSLHEPWAGIDWERLARTVRLGVHFLDNVIDQNRYPLPQIETQTRANRRIGLGVMGWADLLVKLRVPYNHEAAFALGDRVMAFVATEARNCSSELAIKRGRFPNWERSAYARDNVLMRNATVTTVAPTGTISIIAGCSSGIEPYYSIVFERTVMDGTRMLEINPLFATAAKRRGFAGEPLWRRIAGARSLRDFPELPEDIRALYLTAADISPTDHVRMQAAFQKHCDSSVSKTINFPVSATREDVRSVFELAYQLDCKGVTVYRDHSRPDQVLAPIPADRPITQLPVSQPAGVRQRPPILNGFTEKVSTGYGNLYVTVNLNEGRPFEVFAHIGKSGYSTMADTEAICRLISLALRSQVPVEAVIRQLRGIGGSRQVFSQGSRISSIPDAIAQILARRFAPRLLEESAGEPPPDLCPECSAPIEVAGGCLSCSSCGYSNC